MSIWRVGSAAIAMMGALSGCGGGDGPADGLSSGASPSYVRGVYTPSSQLGNLCANPRTGRSPYTGETYPDRRGTIMAENLWLRSWTNEYYFWYREVGDIDPAAMNPLTYFDLLKTNALTSSGRAKDRFHFTYPTDVWESLATSGADVGYGIEWLLLSASFSVTPRDIAVAYIHPNTPASQLSVPIKRGERVISVDGVAIDSASLAQIGAALFPDTAGSSHTLGLRDAVTSATRTVTLTSVVVTLTSVQNVKTIGTSNGVVGYLQFNDHLAQSEAALYNAMQTFQTAGVDDLVIDMRYNGGGYLRIASELGYMIAGAATAGRTFEREIYNDKFLPGTPMPFYSASPAANGFSLPANTPLPTLNLRRVYVLTGANTCSASESLMNGLRGIGIDVYQVGGTTCGKPYGFYPTDNCGTTYFSIQLQTVNAVGNGNYADGFTPSNNTTASGQPERILGCSVVDDFTRALGDEQESRLAAALNYRLTGACPMPPSTEPTSLDRQMLSVQLGELEAGEGKMLKSPLRENSWYR